MVAANSEKIPPEELSSRSALLLENAAYADVDRFSSSFFFINTGHTLSQAPQAIHADRSIITGNSNPALSFFI